MEKCAEFVVLTLLWNGSIELLFFSLARATSAVVGWLTSELAMRSDDLSIACAMNRLMSSNKCCRVICFVVMDVRKIVQRCPDGLLHSTGGRRKTSANGCPERT
jgi:hypothetical protein